MKRLGVVFLVSTLLTAVFVLPVAAKGPAGVANTIHNLSATAPPGDPNIWFGMTPYASTEDEVCVFCHTPHGGTLTGPLWNHVEPTNPFTHYNSATLAPYIKGLGVGRSLGNESLLCMSCHDGSVSVYALHNESNDTGTPNNLNLSPGETDVRIIWLPDGKGPNIGGGAAASMFGPATAGGDLSNDHPISFSYSGLLGSAEYAVGGVKDGKLRLQPDAESRGVEFFGADNRVECSSCHDPHVDYVNNAAYRPFLITSNSGSKLCLACHIK